MANPIDLSIKHEDFVKEIVALKGSQITFTLHPDSWAKCPVKAKLNWQGLNFTEANQVNVPKKRGIYAFIIEPPVASFPPHGYLVYVGITGHESKTRTLYARYGEYMKRLQERKRPRVLFVLAHWFKNVRFYYAHVDNRHNLANLELAFNDAFIPPGVTGDFSAEIRPQTKALV